MTSLVEDLLLLARLDSGRPLERHPVDLTRLLVEAVSDAQVVDPPTAGGSGPRRRRRDAVRGAGRRCGCTRSSRSLLTNARKVHPAGTTVTVRCAATGSPSTTTAPGSRRTWWRTPSNGSCAATRHAPGARRSGSASGSPWSGDRDRARRERLAPSVPGDTTIDVRLVDVRPAAARDDLDQRRQRRRHHLEELLAGDGPGSATQDSTSSSTIADQPRTTSRVAASPG